MLFTDALPTATPDTRHTSTLSAYVRAPRAGIAGGRRKLRTSATVPQSQHMILLKFIE